MAELGTAVAGIDLPQIFDRELVVAWLSAYVIVGCLLALISLISSTPEQLSPRSFVLAHALWPATLVLYLVWVLSPSHRD
jgi:hypothetical protein